MTEEEQERVTARERQGFVQLWLKKELSERAFSEREPWRPMKRWHRLRTQRSDDGLTENREPGPWPTAPGRNGKKTAVPFLTLTSTVRTLAPLTQDTLSMPS